MVTSRTARKATGRTANIPTTMKPAAIDRFGAVEPEPKRRSRIRFVSYDAEAGPREFAPLARAATEARLRVPIAAVYPLAQAAKAHQRLERGHILGRIAPRIRRRKRMRRIWLKY